MRRVRLIHWNAAEATDRARVLRSAGYRVTADPLSPTGLRELRRRPPAAVVIDLSRQPSSGRDVALTLRQYAATRRVPLVFVEGAPDKVAHITGLLPDAAFTTWGRIRAALRHAIAHPPAAPVVPGSSMAGYAGTPLPKKLGIKMGSVVSLIEAPPGFERTLGELPERAVLQRRARGRSDLTVWFVTSQKALAARIRAMVPRAERGGLWIAWPKKTARVPSDLSEVIVRRVGLASGLVDFKICAIDQTWSGLRFSRRS